MLLHGCACHEPRGSLAISILHIYTQAHGGVGCAFHPRLRSRTGRHTLAVMQTVHRHCTDRHSAIAVPVHSVTPDVIPGTDWSIDTTSTTAGAAPTSLTASACACLFAVYLSSLVWQLIAFNWLIWRLYQFLN